MTIYFIFKFLHILGAIVILGTGTGIAFFMLMAHRSGDAAFIAATASIVVIADLLFTTSAVILQPFTGGFLMQMSSTATNEPWIVVSLILYAVAGLFWLPVVFMQIEMRNLARQAVADKAQLPPRYHVLFRRWFWFGFPGFGAVVAILWLMIARPSF
ncbi:DUF2269 family protein [Tardiphaga sp.]|uniref:DUF2269 family protein n=1 Tax=Tardiphaga sp. TaxID=1926292 RepID=UPI00352B0DB5